jgi:hypothetical protein
MAPKENRMKNADAPDNRTTRRIPPIACATALAVAFTLSLPSPARAHDLTPPPVPDKLQAPEGAEAFLVGHARGTQNYVCLPTAAGGFAYTLFTPEATLFRDNGKQVITHFFSPNLPRFEPNGNPRVVASGTIRATWQHSDTSRVWAFVAQPDHASTDPDFVETGAIAWLKLTVVGTQKGPTGGDALAKTTFIQRVNTSGGLAPSTGCASSADVGKQAFVPYRADYVFFQGPETDDHN